MTKITKGGAMFRLLLAAAVAFIGAVLFDLQGVKAPSWGFVFSPLVFMKALAAALFAVSQFVNTAWAQANTNAEPGVIVPESAARLSAANVGARTAIVERPVGSPVRVKEND